MDKAETNALQAAEESQLKNAITEQWKIQEQNLIAPPKTNKPTKITEVQPAQMYSVIDLTSMPHIITMNKIDAIKLVYNFKDDYDLIAKFNGFIEWLQFEKINEKKLTPTDDIKVLENFIKAFLHIKHAQDILDRALTPTSMPVREKLFEMIKKVKQQFPSKQNIANECSSLHAIEDILLCTSEDDIDTWIYSCEILIKKAKDFPSAGGRPNSIAIEEALPHLIKLYEEGTGLEPTISYNNRKYSSAFYDLLIELNNILNRLHPNFSLGTGQSIGFITKRDLSKYKA